MNDSEPLIMKPVLHDQVTVVTIVYHRSTGVEEVFSAETRYTRDLKTTEQPYQRRNLRAPTSPRKLDFGWLEGKVGIVLIENTPKHLVTQQDNDDTDSQTIIIRGGTGENGTRIGPGHGWAFDVIHPEQLTISCPHGGAFYRITVYPR